jgi:uncharacterized protein
MPAYFDFTVSLQGVLPRPWRRFLLPVTARFATLHSAIQDACGWSGSHLYLFRSAGAYDHGAIAGLIVDDTNLMEPMADASTTPLMRYFGAGEGTTCLYVYDFGDDWVHDVQLNEVVSLPERITRRLSGGEHSFPPDDCGGPHGYGAIQTALRTGKDPEGVLQWARDVWEWTGEFDLDAVRKRFEPRQRKQRPGHA